MKRDFNIEMLTNLCQYLLDGEPVFIIRAHDKASVPAINAYAREVEKIDGKNVQGIMTHLVRIREWQVKHPKQMKVPD